MMGYVQRAARWLLTVGHDDEDLGPTRRLSVVQFAVGWKIHPSEHIKRRYLRRVFEDRGHDVLVESGTYLGDTVASFEQHARLVVSVELHPGLYERACRRFAGNPKVRLLHGDGVEVIPRVVAELDAPPLIWLDGHYSKEGTARGDEMEPALTLLARLGPVTKPGTTVVIDDLRMFGAHSEVPCLEDLLRVAREAFPQATIHTGMDSLVIES
jgi:hypothetical protein